MTATKKFIKDAIKGGWIVATINPETHNAKAMTKDWVFDPYEPMPVEQILLDPKAWSAVGKVRGWGDKHDYPDRVYEAWDTFFYQLYNGYSIEEALAAISK